eukprot:m.32437 g.32437  ORF g.32437 m.32437 type:complete len:493 (-) comp6384_c0_seq2:112-1590(-)
MTDDFDVGCGFGWNLSPEKRRSSRLRAPSQKCVQAMQFDFYGSSTSLHPLKVAKTVASNGIKQTTIEKKKGARRSRSTRKKEKRKMVNTKSVLKEEHDVLDIHHGMKAKSLYNEMIKNEKCCGCGEKHLVAHEELTCCMCLGSFHESCRSKDFCEPHPFTLHDLHRNYDHRNMKSRDAERDTSAINESTPSSSSTLSSTSSRNILSFQSVPTHCVEDFCKHCKRENLRKYITPYRLGSTMALSQGGRHVLGAVACGRTPRSDKNGRIVDPFGCVGFEFQRQAVSNVDIANLASLIGPFNEMNWEMRTSMLTPSITDKSRKIMACNEAQRQLRGGRYAYVPLRASGTVPLVEYELENGENISDYVRNLFQPRDPFVTDTVLLCQQFGWHFEDLELHRDKDRRDKTHNKQEVSDDGVGDRISSLTLQHTCWVVLREISNPKNYFCLYLRPGDLYTMSGPARWAWQHGIMLSGEPTCHEKTRISMIFRFLEEHPY